MKPDKLVGTVPRKKRRAGVIPTRKERDKSKDIERLDKHDKKYYFWQTPISHY